MKEILTKIDKIKLASNMIKAFTGIIGGSLVLTENHPYLALGVLGIGAIANEVIIFFNEKK